MACFLSWFLFDTLSTCFSYCIRRFLGGFEVSFQYHAKTTTWAWAHIARNLLHSAATRRLSWAAWLWRTTKQCRFMRGWSSKTHLWLHQVFQWLPSFRNQKRFHVIILFILALRLHFFDLTPSPLKISAFQDFRSAYSKQVWNCENPEHSKFGFNISSLSSSKD